MPAPALPAFATHSILYAEDFDDPAPPDEAGAPPEAEPEVIEPSFTVAEIEAARAAAYAEGTAAERARAAADDEEARSRTLVAVATALADAKAAARAAAEDAAEALAQAVLAVVAAGLPALCAHHGEHESRALLQALLPTLGLEPRITVRLNPRLLGAVRNDLARLDPEIAAAVHLVPTDAMPPGDVRVSWDGGTCERSAAATCAAVRETLAPLGLLLPGLPTAERPPPDPTRTLETAHVE